MRDYISRYGHSINELLDRADARTTGATVFAYHVQDPHRYVVAEFDSSGTVRPSRCRGPPGSRR